MFRIAVMLALALGQGAASPTKYDLSWRPKSGQVFEYRVTVEVPFDGDDLVFESRMRLRVATSFGPNHSEVLDFLGTKVSQGDEQFDLDEQRDIWVRQGPMKDEDEKRLAQFLWIPELLSHRDAGVDDVAVGSHWEDEDDGEVTVYDIQALQTVAGKPALKLKLETRDEKKQLLKRGTLWLDAKDGSLVKANLDIPGGLSRPGEEKNTVLGRCTLERVSESVLPPKRLDTRFLKAYQATADIVAKWTGQFSEAERNLDNFDVEFEEDDATFVVKLVPKANVKELQTAEHPKGRMVVAIYNKSKLELQLVSFEDPD